MLSAFDEEERQLLGSYGKFVRYRPEDAVIREGGRQDNLYYLIRGLLHAVHNVSDGATPVGAIRDGEWFGEINIFDPQSASATVISRSDALVWRMSRARLEDLLNEHPVLGCQLLLSVSELLAQRIRTVLGKLNATWEISS